MDRWIVHPYSQEVSFKALHFVFLIEEFNFTFLLRQQAEYLPIKCIIENIEYTSRLFF